MDATGLERSVEEGVNSRGAAKAVSGILSNMFSNLFDCRRYGVLAVAEKHPKGGYKVSVIVPKAGEKDEQLRETIKDQIPYFMSPEPIQPICIHSETPGMPCEQCRKPVATKSNIASYRVPIEIRIS